MEKTYMVNTDFPFFRLQLHPFHIGKIALEFGIIPTFARYRIIIRIVPVAHLRTFQSVLPYTIWSFAHPRLALDQLFWIIETNTHDVNNAIESIRNRQSYSTIFSKRPLYFLETAVLVGGNQSVCHGFVAECKTGKMPLVGILGILCFLIESILVIVIIEAILRTVATLGGNKTRTITERDGSVVHFHIFQASVSLREHISILARLCGQHAIRLADNHLFVPFHFFTR